MVINSNQFLNNNDTTLFVRNLAHPQLAALPANVCFKLVKRSLQVTISKNSFKFNRGKYVITIGLNEDAPKQKLVFNQQNEVRSLFSFIVTVPSFPGPREHC